MNRSEMIGAVKRLFVSDCSEEELDLLLGNLVKTTPHAGISDMIFYPDEERTPEQIVDEALRREREYAAETSPQR